MKKEEMQAILLLAGIKVISSQEIMNKYWPRTSNYYECIISNPWWFVTTDIGVITIGWRKRVIHIDWSTTDMKCLIGPDDVTKDETFIHAWSEEKAIEYLKKIKIHFESQSKEQREAIRSSSAIGGFKISIDDSYVEYSYDFNIPGNTSINDIAFKLANSYNIDAPRGILRFSHGKNRLGK